MPMMKVIILVIMVMRMVVLPRVSHADKITARRQPWPPVRSHHATKSIFNAPPMANKSSSSSPSSGAANKPYAGLTLITRDDWLAKEYFGYLCAPSECISDQSKISMKDQCFQPHEKLKLVLNKCFAQPDSRCIPGQEERSINCVLRESKLDSQMIPLQLHDCVDQMITMKDWKCIRRTLINKLKSVMDMLAAREQKVTSSTSIPFVVRDSTAKTSSSEATEDPETVAAISSLISSAANASGMTNVTIFDK